MRPLRQPGLLLATLIASLQLRRGDRPSMGSRDPPRTMDEGKDAVAQAHNRAAEVCGGEVEAPAGERLAPLRRVRRARGAVAAGPTRAGAAAGDHAGAGAAAVAAAVLAILLLPEPPLTGPPWRRHPRAAGTTAAGSMQPPGDVRVRPALMPQLPQPARPLHELAGSTHAGTGSRRAAWLDF